MHSWFDEAQEPPPCTRTGTWHVPEPEELAGPVVFLASDHAKYITGSTLNVSGGFLMY